MDGIYRQRRSHSKQPSRARGKVLDSAASKASCVASKDDWDLPRPNSGYFTVHDPKIWAYEFPPRPHSQPKNVNAFASSGDLESADARRTILWAAATGESKVISFLLAQTPSDVSFRNCYGQTALSLAAEHGHLEVMQLLLTRANIDVNAPDMDGQSPLAWSSFQGHLSLVEMLLDRHDLAANSKDVDGNTALSWAAANGHYEVTELLLERLDVEISPINHWGQTPRALAEVNGHDGIAALLAMGSG